MSARTTAFGFAFLALAANDVACASSAQEDAAYAATVTVEAPLGPNPNGWTLGFTEARLAFGPVYLCASASGSSTLCEASVGELRAVVEVDLLRQGPQPLGTIRGLTGHVESASLDFGIVWFDTFAKAVPLTSAARGHSIYAAGTATKGTIVVPFVATIDVTPQFQGQTGFPTLPAVGDVDGDGSHVDVGLAPYVWFGAVDFDRALAEGRVPLQIAPGAVEHNAVLVALRSLRPPSFQFRP